MFWYASIILYDLKIVYRHYRYEFVYKGRTWLIQTTSPSPNYLSYKADILHRSFIYGVDKR